MQEQQKEFETWRTEEYTSLLKVMEWETPEKVTEEMTATRNYLVSRGFSREELSDLIDHRYFRVAHEAMLGNRAKSAAKDLPKKLRAKLSL